jgi:hypothetical protein
MPRLKLVKFTNVNVLNLFIESNQGGAETTKVQKIALFGQTGDLDKFNVAGESRENQSCLERKGAKRTSVYRIAWCMSRQERGRLYFFSGPALPSDAIGTQQRQCSSRRDKED